MPITIVDRLAGGVSRFFRTHPTADVPTGAMVQLGDRGATYVTDSARITSGPDAGGVDPLRAARPPIILLHAVVTTGLLSWYSVIDDLSADFRVITMDQRWHGRGIRSPRFTLDDCADDVTALADALGIDRFVAAGFSMGGGTAQLTWQRHHDRVSGLVLASTGPYFGSSTTGRPRIDALTRFAAQRFATPVPGLGPHALDERGLSDGAWALRQVRSTRLSHMSEIGYALGQFDSRPWLAEIDVPTAVCVTTRDRVIPIARQQLLVDGIPGAQRFDVAAGHACCVLQSEIFTPVFVEACGWVSTRTPKAHPPESTSHETARP
ncbi:alpha/beta fold hydrolase [Williamsia sp. MIQD14]|uniref:alpha/beta fold hydrolase n=1 Tax=Williamsia sp. MIQD14 TaxID=3425703 RepID=UPI003DA1126D